MFEDYSIKSLNEKYVDCLYFTIISMTTIGYGDITPKSNLERIYTIIFTILACFIFGYSLNVIGGIF